MMYTLAMTHMQKKTDASPSATKSQSSPDTNININTDCNNKLDTSILITIDQNYYGCVLPIEIQPQLMTKYRCKIIYPHVYDDEITI